MYEIYGENADKKRQKEREGECEKMRWRGKRVKEREWRETERK